MSVHLLLSTFGRLGFQAGGDVDDAGPGLHLVSILAAGTTATTELELALLEQLLRFQGRRMRRLDENGVGIDVGGAIRHVQEAGG